MARQTPIHEQISYWLACIIDPALETKSEEKENAKLWMQVLCLELIQVCQENDDLSLVQKLSFVTPVYEIRGSDGLVYKRFLNSSSRLSNQVMTQVLLKNGSNPKIIKIEDGKEEEIEFNDF